MDSVMTAWLSGFVRRWHSNPDLSDLHDEVAAHQGRCVILALKLFPGASRDLLIACATHDAAERFVGDIAYTKRDPEFAAKLDEALCDMGLMQVLTEADKQRLKFIDRLDAYLFVQHRRPNALNRDGWPEQAEWLVWEWMALGAQGAWQDAIR